MTVFCTKRSRKVSAQSRYIHYCAYAHLHSNVGYKVCVILYIVHEPEDRGYW